MEFLEGRIFFSLNQRLNSRRFYICFDSVRGRRRKKEKMNLKMSIFLHFTLFRSSKSRKKTRTTLKNSAISPTLEETLLDPSGPKLMLLFINTLNFFTWVLSHCNPIEITMKFESSEFCRISQVNPRIWKSNESFEGVASQQMSHCIRNYFEILRFSTKLTIMRHIKCLLLLVIIITRRWSYCREHK